MTALIITLLLQYRYFVIIPLTIIEGPLVMMIAGFLLNLGYFELIPLYIILMLGDLLGDVIWYYVGYFYGHRFVGKYGKYFSITEKNIATVERLFHKHHSPILIFSKVTSGFGFAIVTLFTAGLVKIPFKKFIILNAIGQIVWTGILLAIGYYLGNFYITFNNNLGLISTMAFIIIIFIMIIGSGKYIKKWVAKKYS